MKRFEYLFTSFLPGLTLFNLESLFKKYGEQGWEYCGQDWGFHIFKRELPEEKKK